MCSHSPIHNPTTMSWDNARRHARALESALDTKLASYSRLAADIAGGGRFGGPSRDTLAQEEEGVGGYRLVEEEVEELLEKVGWAWAGRWSEAEGSEGKERRCYPRSCPSRSL